MSNHQFNEAINGVFRSKKNDFKVKQNNSALSESTSNKSSAKQFESVNKGQKTLKQIINKKKSSQANHAVVDKENNSVQEKHQDDE